MWRLNGGDEGVGQPEVPARHGRRRRIRRRFVRSLAAVCLLVLALAATVWIQRRPIADNFVRRELERRGVEARYRVAEIGLGRQRLTNVVLGDPASPDLVADWIEVDTDVGLGGAAITGARAGQVRLKATLSADGTVSFGAIDRLLPPPSGKPFALPDLDVAVQDGRIRLVTPYGIVGMKVAGKGGLSDGFTGQFAAVADTMRFGDCRVDRMAAKVAIRIDDRRPALTGPVRAAATVCGEASVDAPQVALELLLNERFDRWRGRATVQSRKVRAPGVTLSRPGGTIGFDGGPSRTTGQIAVRSASADSAVAAANGLSATGRYVAGRQGLAFDGTVGASGARAGSATLRQIAELGDAANGTPVAPLVRAAVRQGIAAARRFDLSARVMATPTMVKVDRLSATSASGARATVSDGGFTWAEGVGATVGGTMTLSGGGLPEAAVQLAQRAPGRAITGNAIIQPYAADGARLAMTPVTFRAGGGGETRIQTQAVLTGPLPGGYVRDLALPVDARWNGAGRLTINPGCSDVGFAGLSVSSLALGPTRLRLCGLDGAMTRVVDGSITGGARFDAISLAGRLGSTPLRLAAGGGRFRLDDMAFTLTNVATRLGPVGRTSELDVMRLDGRIAAGGVAGTFDGGAGQIANVPLLIRRATGDWRFAGSELSLGARLQVRDAGDTARFLPLASDDFTLSLNGNAVRAAGTLRHPEKGVKVADVTIAHDLGAGTGNAVLDVPGIAFDEDFQPDELTPITFGVIADVVGSVSGRGNIAWSPDAVTSTGTFRTAGTDLAAAFGPVTGLSGEIRFTDLLGLVSAPGQVATIAEVNPGIPVPDGVVRYQLIEGQRVAIEGGRWALGGGEMTLEPTILDFGADRERRMTFRVTGVDAGLFLQQFNFENINATGLFDGELPMIFDANGGRIEGGRLQSRGGGNLSYVGEVTKEDVGFWGNVAFQALKSIDYERLNIEMDGPLAGEMVTAIRFAGISQGEGTSSNFLIRRLAKLPFVFNVRIKAPFRQLIDSVQSYYDPTRLIERNLPALQAEQDRRDQGLPPQPLPAPAAPDPVAPVPARPAAPDIQRSESETMP